MSNSNAQLLLEGNYNDDVLGVYNILLNEHKLTFEPDDIRYLIVKKGTEITDMLSQIKDAKGKNFTIEQV